MSTEGIAKLLSNRGSMDTSNTKEGDVFAAWKHRKESMNPLKDDGKLLVPPGQRRLSNVRGILSKGVKGMIDLRRMTLFKAKSDVSESMLKPQVAKENTYKMKPDQSTVFSPAKVTNVVKQLLEDEVSDLTYSHEICSQLSCELAEKVKEKVKEMKFQRYKIATNVFVGQAGDQGLELASRCCWDHTTDNFASISYNNKTICVMVLVFGVYFE